MVNEEALEAAAQQVQDEEKRVRDRRRTLDQARDLMRHVEMLREDGPRLYLRMLTANDIGWELPDRAREALRTALQEHAEELLNSLGINPPELHAGGWIDRVVRPGTRSTDATS